MYIPKKKWMFYEMRMIKNLLMNDDGETHYRLGDDKWMRDIYRIACLRRMDSYHVAYKYSTTDFQKTYILSQITGDVNMTGDCYWLFRRHYGYNSIGINYARPFLNKMESSLLWDQISFYNDAEMKKMGLYNDAKELIYKNKFDDKYSVFGGYEDEKW